MYNPHDWYWLRDDQVLFSSRTATTLSLDDPDYLAFVTGGNIPTRWPCNESGEQSDEALEAVLSAYGVAGPATSVATARRKRIAELTLRCATEIIGGYRSAALGDDYLYPSAVTDQLNMMGSVTASLLPDLPADWTTPFWCADQNGIWAFRMHTAAEIQAVGSDGKAHIVACQSILETLTQTVRDATTLDAVAAIVWP